MSYYEPLTYIVPSEEDGMMLKNILRDRMQLSRKLLSRLKLTPEGITVNGERKYTSVRVQTGDVVEVRMEEEESEDILPQDIEFDVIYEDEHLLIVNKPAGMIVHPTHGHYMNTLANAVVHYWQQRGEKVRFRPVHRLDRETSGVLAIAKNPYAHQHISEQMQAGTVDKRYVAVVRGSVKENGGTIEGPIDRDPESPHVRIVTPTGYPSVTHYEVLERYGDAATLVRLKLETGRTHQIRVHMNHIGHPLLGDEMYGVVDGEGRVAACSTDQNETAEGESLGRQALHASTLAFEHPAGRGPVRFEAPLPTDLNELLDRLKPGYLE